MLLSLLHGDITQAPAEAVCSSTNPHLELMAGTGGALRSAGGPGVQDACAAIIRQRHEKDQKRYVDTGTVHRTTAGKLPFRAIYHAVAIDPFHHSSAEVVRTCTRRCLELAAGDGVRTLAMPVFASGNGDMDFMEALRAMREELLAWKNPFPEKVLIVCLSEHRVELGRAVIG